MKYALVLALLLSGVTAQAETVHGEGARSVITALQVTGVKGKHIENGDENQMDYQFSAKCEVSYGSALSIDDAKFLVPNSYKCEINSKNSKDRKKSSNASAKVMFDGLTQVLEGDAAMGKGYAVVENMRCTINLEESRVEDRFVCNW